MLFAALLSVDPALGRLDYHSLSDQALMEMLIDGMKDTYKEYYQDTNGNILDIFDWPGVELDSDDVHVKSIDFQYRQFTDKPFPFQYIPNRVEDFEAEEVNFHGTLDTAILPPHLRSINVSENKLHGPFCIKDLPQTLIHIYIGGNKFSGSLKLSDLRDTVALFQADHNDFIGEVSLSDLPSHMEDLCLDNNKLSGSIRIEKLPECMDYIGLSNNAFTGDFTFLAMPRVPIKMDIRKNQLSGKVVLDSCAKGPPFLLKSDPITSFVDETGKKHKLTDRITIGEFLFD